MDDEKDTLQLSVPEPQAGLYVSDGWTRVGATPYELDGVRRVLVRKKFRLEVAC